MAKVPLVMRIVSESVAIANYAGKIIQDIANRGNLGIVEKAVNDFQTEADRASQRYIIESLSSKFNSVAIIGEETLDQREKHPKVSLECTFSKDVLSKTCPESLVNTKEADTVIWVDPLDGTAEFTHGLLDHVTVLIGVAVHGKAVAGVIHQPYYNYKKLDAPLGRTLWGIVGLGAYGIAKGIPPVDKRIVTTTRLRQSKSIAEAVEAMSPDEVIYAGGCGYKTMLVIEGAAHAFVFGGAGSSKWDTCAPEAIIHAVGGRLTNLYGNEFRYHTDVQKENTGGLLATMTDHDWYVSRVPTSVKDELLPNGD